jgi:hypothetical protein
MFSFSHFEAYELSALNLVFYFLGCSRFAFIELRIFDNTGSICHHHLVYHLAARNEKKRCNINPLPFSVI